MNNQFFFNILFYSINQITILFKFNILLKMINEIIDDIQKPEKKDMNNDLANNSLIEINKVDITKFLDDEEKKEYEISYDSITKRIIVISKKMVKIFNRHGTKLLKTFNYEYFETISDVALDKDINYLLFYYNFNNFENNQVMILCIDIKSKEIIESFKNKIYENLLGMFFVHSNCFCFISPNYIEYHMIDSKKVYNDNKNKINFDKCNIINYYYNSQYTILIIERSDYQMNLYNLRKLSYFKEPIKTFSLFKKPNKLLKLFTNSGSRNLMDLKKNPNQKYKQNQFFIQNIYGELYIVCLFFEKEEIHILKIKNISDINFNKKENKNMIIIQIKGIGNCSTIQFINTYIFVYNFSKKEVIIIDVNLNNLNIPKNNSNKVLIHLKNIELPFFDLNKQKVYIKSGNVETIDINNKKTIYSLNFNYQQFLLNPNFNNKFFKMVNLIERHNTKTMMINMTKYLIVKNEKSKFKYLLINYFCEYILKNNIILNTFLNRNNIEIETFILNDRYISKLQDKCLSIDDILKQIFEKILIENYLKNDDEYIKVIYCILYFYIILINNQVNEKDKFDEIFYLYLNSIKDKNKIYELFNFFHPKKKEIIFKLFEQDKCLKLQEFGINLLIKNKLYKEAFDKIIEIQGLKCGILFLKKYKKYMTYENINSIFISYFTKMKKDSKFKKIIIRTINQKQKVKK